MKLLTFLFRTSRRMVFAVAVAGALSGVCSAGLIALINASLHHGASMPLKLALAFLVLAIAKIGTQYVSQLLLVHFSQTTMLELCEDLCQKVLGTPFQKLEQMGSARILTTLTDDVAILSAAIQAIPSLATNIAVLVGCSAYLIWLSWPVFLGMLGMLIIGALSYKVFHAKAHAAIQRAREGREDLFRHFRSLIEGIKELKLHRARREAFMKSEVATTTEFLRHQNVTAMTQYMLADSWSQLMFYALIGLLLFAAPSLARISVEALTGYVFAALYMMTPVWVIIGTVPIFVRGQVSLNKIQELGASLKNVSVVEAGAREPQIFPESFHLEMRRVVFSYPDEAARGNHFVLGPVDFTLRAGEVVFVTGGNGSGKSTFVKLLVGLYAPQSGEIRVDGRAVDDANADQYREYFSVVFSDYYLFDNLLGLNRVGLDSDVKRYLVQLQMDHKVTIENGRFSTTALSQGQRKRLALLVAYLEDRPIYVFDEWAADQDPGYRKVFYEQLLPELKSRRKAVVVITHDDRFFHLGDRVIKFDSGQLVESWEHVPR
ncbi:MAG: cyclic peptide export ABC transporter [Candidatus Acidiferrales bacterium]